VLLLATVGVGVALTLASVLLKRRRRRLTEGDALASLLSGFGLSLATVKGLVPITWTVVVWATTSQFLLMPGTSMDDLLLAMAIGAFATVAVALVAYVNNLQ
jgi:hypothetical protein